MGKNDFDIDFDFDEEYRQLKDVCFIDPEFAKTL